MASLKDPFSGLSHLIGALAALPAGAWLTWNAWQSSRPSAALGFAVFTVGLLALYGASAAYHLLRVPAAQERLLRRIDHMMIYVLIAATYTPFCLAVLPGAWGTGILIAIWALALGGMALTLFYLDTPRWVTISLYLVMGWLCLIAIRPLTQALPADGLAWLVSGGLAYSIGALVYARKRPDPYPGRFGFHEIWHLFVMAGSLCHFLALAAL